MPGHSPGSSSAPNRGRRFVSTAQELQHRSLWAPGNPDGKTPPSHRSWRLTDSNGLSQSFRGASATQFTTTRTQSALGSLLLKQEQPVYKQLKLAPASWDHAGPLVAGEHHPRAMPPEPSRGRTRGDPFFRAPQQRPRTRPRAPLLLRGSSARTVRLRASAASLRQRQRTGYRRSR